MIVDCAAYVGGVRQTDTLDLDDVGAWLTKPDTFVWLGLRIPDRDEIARVSAVFDVHPLAAEDAFKVHRRPKVEAFDDTLVVVVRTARNDDDQERLITGEISLLVSPRFVIGVRHGKGSPLDQVRARLERDEERLSRGPVAVLHAVLDRVVDDYLPVAVALDDQVTDVEEHVFSESEDDPTRRIYSLQRRVLLFHRASEPLREPLEALARGRRPWVTPDDAPYFRDVADHLARVLDRLATLRALLGSALEANLTQVSLRQNEDMRKISAWVAIAAVPTMLAGIYGMNVDLFGADTLATFPVIVGIMAVCSLALYLRFRRSGWL